MLASAGAITTTSGTGLSESVSEAFQDRVIQSSGFRQWKGRSDTYAPSPSGSVTDFVGSDAATIVQEQTARPLRLLPVIPHLNVQPRPTFVAIQEWEGVVVEISDQEFVGRLTDLTDRRRPSDEEATFSIAELSEGDRDLLVGGALFRWTIGFQRLPGGTKQRISQVVFRRLPQWTKEEVSRANDLAAIWAQHFASG